MRIRDESGGEVVVDRAAVQRVLSTSHLSPDAHGWLDYGLACALALVPALFAPGTPWWAATVCHGLALGLWLLSVFTRYPFGLFEKLPLRVHCAIELMLAPLVFVLPWLANVGVM